jgi:hypothetical protein
MPRNSKYGAVRTTIDNITFDSKREARRYSELKILESGGIISNLEANKALLRLPIRVNGQAICDYVADFFYVQDGKRIWEDVKGCKTPIYKLKKKLVLAVHGIEIQEV